MEILWIYLVNTFLSVTRNSYLRMLKISQFHYNALLTKAGNADYDALIAFYLPRHQAYVDAYAQWTSQQGIKKGKRTLVKDLLSAISNQWIDKWEYIIRGIHAEGSPRYVELLPKGRKPFQTGSIASRINALVDLSNTIGTEAALASLKNDVNLKHTELQNARSAQQGAQSGTKNKSTELDNLRKAAGEGLYHNLGALMALHYQTPENVASYYDLANIRRSPQSTFTNSVNSESTKNVFKRTLAPTKVIVFNNTGSVPLQYMMVPEKNDTTAPIIKTVMPGEEETYTAAELGASPTNVYLNVRNDSTEFNGTYEVDIM